MKKRCIVIVSILIAMIIPATSAIAAETATKDEAMAKCKEAAQLAKEKGMEAALSAVNDKNGPFVWKDSYVFAIDMEKQTVTAHPIRPQLIGKSLFHIKDKNGKLFFAEFINLAKEKGAGWVSYMWPKPGSNTPVPKVSYVLRVGDTNQVMVAGVYE